MTAEEPAIDPDQKIIDSHLHLWDILPVAGSMQMPQQFLLPQLLSMVEHSGHNVTHSVFVECHTMYRKDGPRELRPVGETEFANGVAAMSASGLYGPCLVAHRIVGTANLSLGTQVAPILDAHTAAAGVRFRGIRCNTAFSEAGMFGTPCDPKVRHMMLARQFREGAGILARMALSLDIWCFHSQIDEVIELADALPELIIILDHVGTLDVHGTQATEARSDWRRSIKELARRPNVFIKLGGLGMDVSNPIGTVIGSLPSNILAQKWRFAIESCIEAFTPKRCMFESNFPPDNASGSYGATWNAFKIITRDFSIDERDQLFFRCAADAYHISLAPEALSEGRA